MRVFVYWNLRRRCFSIRAEEGENRGRIVGHTTYVELADVDFMVSEAGRQRVIRNRRKNVHAGVRGYLVRTEGGPPAGGRSVTYNPYDGATFMAEFWSGRPEKMTPILGAKGVRGYAVGGRPALFADGDWV